VLNWNGGPDTVDCLESLAQANLDRATVLVVDNGSRDDSLARIRGRFPSQRILVLAENQGYAGGNNAGIRAALDAGAGGVLLLNNDTRVAPDFLQSLAIAGIDGTIRNRFIACVILRMPSSNASCNFAAAALLQQAHSGSNP